MTRVRGWCHNHETPMPLWRQRHSKNAAAQALAHDMPARGVGSSWRCRVCGLMDMPPDLDGIASWIGRSVEANDTANSPATSTWLPRVWVNDPTQFTTLTHNIRDTERCVPDVSEFMRGGSTNAPVVWFRCVDADVAGVERFAATSLLADQLRREEAGQ